MLLQTRAKCNLLLPDLVFWSIRRPAEIHSAVYDEEMLVLTWSKNEEDDSLESDDQKQKLCSPAGN